MTRRIHRRLGGAFFGTGDGIRRCSAPPPTIEQASDNPGKKTCCGRGHCTARGRAVELDQARRSFGARSVTELGPRIFGLTDGKVEDDMALFKLTRLTPMNLQNRKPGWPWRRSAGVGLNRRGVKRFLRPDTPSSLGHAFQYEPWRERRNPPISGVPFGIHHRAGFTMSAVTAVLPERFAERIRKPVPAPVPIREKVMPWRPAGGACFFHSSNQVEILAIV